MSTEESSLGYPGWRVVALAFGLAVASWSLAFYGPGIYLLVLHRQHGWPIADISALITAYFFSSAIVTAFIGDTIARFGSRNVVVFGLAALCLGAAAMGQVTAFWQLVPAFAILGLGWACANTAVINAIVAPWFRHRVGLAINLAMNGASTGGIVMAPLFTLLHSEMGFGPTSAAIAAAAFMLLIVPAYLLLGREPGCGSPAVSGTRAGIAPLRRATLLRSRSFLTISIGFALALTAQVAFLTHQLSYLTPQIGAGLAAAGVSIATFAAIVGRMIAGLVVDRLGGRPIAALNFALQAVAISMMIIAPSMATLLAGCALFGLAVGNVTSLYGILTHQEFPAAHTARIVSLLVAINQVSFSFGPGIVGWLRDHSGSYRDALVFCVVLELLAIVVVLSGLRRR